MGIISTIKQAFAGPTTDDHAPSAWSFSTSSDDVDDIFRRSHSRPQLVYKHSSACSISWMTKAALERAIGEIRELADCHHVDVIEHRGVSTEIAARSGVIHQSPQAIVVHEGVAVWDGSHGGVHPEPLLEALRAVCQGSSAAEGPRRGHPRSDSADPRSTTASRA